MIRALQALSRLRPASVFPPVLGCCRFASKSKNKPWMEQRHVYKDMGSNRVSKYGYETSEEELELEDVEDKIEALVK